MKRLLLAALIMMIICFPWSVIAVEKTEIFWDAPTTYTDGSPVTGPLIYKIYCGTSQSIYTKSTLLPAGTLSTAISPVACATTGANYFAVTAIDNLGRESDFSNELYVVAVSGRFYDAGAKIPSPPSQLQHL